MKVIVRTYGETIYFENGSNFVSYSFGSDLVEYLGTDFQYIVAVIPEDGEVDWYNNRVRSHLPNTELCNHDRIVILFLDDRNEEDLAYWNTSYKTLDQLCRNCLEGAKKRKAVVLRANGDLLKVGQEAHYDRDAEIAKEEARKRALLENGLVDKTYAIYKTISKKDLNWVASVDPNWINPTSTTYTIDDEYINVHFDRIWEA